MQRFIYEQLPARVIFGPGSFGKLVEEVGGLGAARALVVSTPGHANLAEEAARQLGTRAAGIYAGAVMHVPVETARAACEETRRLKADCVVAIGGGSTIGLAKAIALETGLPILAVPTTYAGSEMTPIYGLTESGRKNTGRDPRVLPKTVIYDALLTLDLPPQITGPSGMNAMAHCVEGLYAQNANPITSLLATDGIRTLSRSLVRCVLNPRDLEARTEALYGAWLAGVVLGSVGMGLHHKLCHVLGGSFNLPHAQTHTIVLPHAVAYNAAAAPEAMRAIADALPVEKAAEVPGALYDLAMMLGARVALRDIGLKESDLDQAAEIACAAPYPSPRPIERVAILKVLYQAFHGVRPGS
jgi:alcohol dehydrogenase class IV